MNMFLALVIGLFGVACVQAHMSIYTTSMWGSEPSNGNSNWAVNPLQDLSFDDWWMHGPKSRNDPPSAHAITQIPAGGIIDLEIATNKAFTSMGQGLWHSPGKSSRVPPNPWANTGSEWPSNLHSPARNDVAGCVLGIAYKSNLNDVKPEDFVIFSVVKDCPARALQAFDVPALPGCPNGKCICSWFWIHNSDGGTDQMYMTPFQCNITNPSKRTLGKPVPAVRCDGKEGWPGGPTSNTCKKPLLPMYWKNLEGNNMANPGHYAPIYSKEYGYPDGAQHQIFTDNPNCRSGSVGATLISSGNNTAIHSSPATILTSPLCDTWLAVQADGNVVLYDASGKARWTSNTAGKGTAPYRFTIQSDGNLVLYDSKSTSLWTSNTVNRANACAPYSLKLRDPSRLLVVDCNGEPLWTA